MNTNTDIHISKLHTADSDSEYSPETCYGCQKNGFDYNCGNNSMELQISGSFDNGDKYKYETWGFICYGCISKNDRTNEIVEIEYI